MQKTKVFGVGLQKTGTSTLGKVLTIMGYKVEEETDYDLVDSLMAGDKEKIKERAVDYDGFEDNPWPLLYKDLDEWYPGSKFILTVRAESNWINSITKHFGSNKSAFREWYYGEGAPLGSEGLYIKKYLSHNNEVQEYFKNRPNDFLIVDFEKGDGWKKICNFLGEPVPNIDFPHLNKNKTLADKLQHKMRGGVKRVKKMFGM